MTRSHKPGMLQQMLDRVETRSPYLVAVFGIGEGRTSLRVSAACFDQLSLRVTPALLQPSHSLFSSLSSSMGLSERG